MSAPRPQTDTLKPSSALLAFFDALAELAALKDAQEQEKRVAEVKRTA